MDPTRLRILEFHETILELLGLSILWTEGVGRIAAEPEHSFASGALDDAAKEKLTKTAIAELGSGSPTINGQLALGLWSALEALVEDVFVLRVQSHPEWLRDPLLAKVKVSLAEYLVIEPDEALRLLASRAEGFQGAAPERFERLLGTVGLAGPLNGDVYRSIRELEEVRHALMHRGGRADTKAIKARFLIELSEGQPIEVNDDHFNRYHLALEAYGETLVARLDAEDAGNAGSTALPVAPRTIDVDEVLESLGAKHTPDSNDRE